MEAPPRNPPLGTEQHRLLALLATIVYGIMEDQLVLVHGFDRDVIVGLVDDGLATAQRGVVTGPGRTAIEVVRIKISDAGRRALEG
jgi:hypothetical protein